MGNRKKKKLKNVSFHNFFGILKFPKLINIYNIFSMRKI